ncbi:TPA: hypothetical protein ENG04_04820, partial [Candidatus Poribacteria bacterium]|nr:hypothetical protein [Candidatus Poribacteria bacterium]HEX29385.1 hypothetical protein [Candidatus Poribacteria bacterium]
MYRSIQFKRTFQTFLCFLFALTFILPSHGDGRFVRDEIFSPSLEGNKLSDPSTRAVTIYLPPSYDMFPKKRYPVLYLLHGFGGDNDSFVKLLTEPVALMILDGLMNGGLVPEMIIVMPDAGNSFGGSFYTNSELIGNYEDYIVKDLVGYIDSNYRTIPDRKGRVIMGASMGGYGSMKLGVKHPDVFRAVVSLCAPLDFTANRDWMIARVLEENPNGMGDPGEGKTFTTFLYALSAAFSPNLNSPPFFVDLPFEYPSGKIKEDVWSRWEEHDIASMLERDPDRFRKLDGIYIDIGDKDELGLTPVVLSFHEKLLAFGIDHEFFMFEGGHSDKPVDRFMNAMKFVSKILAQPSSVPSHVLPTRWGEVKD